MGFTEFGNFTIGEITKMKVDFIGRDLFCDTDFCKTNGDISWSNFIDKIYNGEKLNLEKTRLFDERAMDIVKGILKLMSEDKTEENKNVKKTLEKFSIFIIAVFYGFFEKLQKNIKEVFTGDFSKKELFLYFFYKYIRDEASSKSMPEYKADQSRPIIARKIILKFFQKDTEGYYRLSMEKANESIRDAFKRSGNNLEKLKHIVDTNRRNSLKYPSTTWKVLQQILNKKDLFENVSEDDKKLYIDSYVSYYFLKHFKDIVQEYIYQADFTELLDSLLDSTKYRLIGGYNSCERFKKNPMNKSEYVIYNRRDDYNAFRREVDTDFFYYGRASSDEMSTALNYKKNLCYVDIAVERIRRILSKNYGKEFSVSQIDRAKEMFFLERICSDEFIGKGCNFYYNWYKGAIEFASYRYENSDSLTNAIECFSIAFNDYRYFAGYNLKDFCEMYIYILLEEWKQTKRAGKIKDLWQFSVAQDLVLEVYNDFKKANFEDPFVKPFELIIRLWNEGASISDLSQNFYLEPTMIQQILIKNEKYLTRKDDDMYRYITKWEEDEMYADDDWE